MKQHITIGQVENDPYVFSKVMAKLGYNREVYDGEIENFIKSDIEKINIGKMIEMLEEKYCAIIEQSLDSSLWNVVLYDKEKNTLYHQFHVAKKELVDALWDAVKSIL